MGKTTLVFESIKDRDEAVYYQSTRGSAEQQSRSFVSDAAAVYPGITRVREEWEAFFGYLAEEDAVVVGVSGAAVPTSAIAEADGRPDSGVVPAGTECVEFGLVSIR